MAKVANYKFMITGQNGEAFTISSYSTEQDLEGEYDLDNINAASWNILSEIMSGYGVFGHSLRFKSISPEDLHHRLTEMTTTGSVSFQEVGTSVVGTYKSPPEGYLF